MSLSVKGVVVGFIFLTIQRLLMKVEMIGKMTKMTKKKTMKTKIKSDFYFFFI
nr:MAG TPA: hypothetical protein [Caudoviricetes sp.]